MPATFELDGGTFRRGNGKSRRGLERVCKPAHALLEARDWDKFFRPAHPRSVARDRPRTYRTGLRLGYRASLGLDSSVARIWFDRHSFFLPLVRLEWKKNSRDFKSF